VIKFEGVSGDAARVLAVPRPRHGGPAIMSGDGPLIFERALFHRCCMVSSERRFCHFAQTQFLGQVQEMGQKFLITEVLMHHLAFEFDPGLVGFVVCFDYYSVLFFRHIQLRALSNNPWAMESWDKFSSPFWMAVLVSGISSVILRALILR